MSRWIYLLFCFFVSIVATILNVGHISDQSGGRSWSGGSSGHSSGGSWSSGGGGGGHK